MASVSSLDKDLRNMRLGKYTPQAANEVRTWIEESLGERLAAGDLLDALKDGSALCKYGTRFYMNIHKWDTLILGLQTSKPRNWPTRCSLQAIPHALRPDGEHLPLLTSLQVTTAQSSSPRHLPNGRPLRKQRPSSGTYVHQCVQ